MSDCEDRGRIEGSPGLPRSQEGDPAFAEPWQAQAFALAVHLHARGLFSWSEWAEALSAELKRPGRAEDGSDYYEAWVAALSGLTARKGLADERRQIALQKAWQRAAAATPHGMTIELANDPEQQAVRD